MRRRGRKALQLFRVSAVLTIMRGITLICLPLTLMVALVTACSRSGGGDQSPGSTTVTPAQLETCAAKMRIKLPPGAKPLGIIDDLPEVAIYLKLEVLPAEAEQMLADPVWKKTKPQDAIKCVATGANKPEWWDPDAVVKFRSMEVEVVSEPVEKKEGLSILVDESDPSKRIVYLVWYRM
jgi:hypothetical protein